MEHYSAFTFLLCPECGDYNDADELQTFCSDCASPLVAQYDLD